MGSTHAGAYSFSGLPYSPKCVDGKFCEVQEVQIPTEVVPRTRNRTSGLSPLWSCLAPCSDSHLLLARCATERTPQRSAPSPPVCRPPAPCLARFLYPWRRGPSP